MVHRCLVLTFTVDKIIYSHVCCFQKGAQNILHILNGILLPDLKNGSLAKCHKRIYFFR